MPEVFLAGLVVEGRRCLVVGGEDEAAAKCRRLLDAGARVELFATSVGEAMRSLVDAHRIPWHEREPHANDTRDAFLIIDTRHDEAGARVLAQRAQDQRYLLSCLDLPALSTVTHVAAVRRGPFQIAVATAGEAPALGARLRASLEAQLGEDLGAFTRQLGTLRRATPSTERRATLARALDGFEWRVTYRLPTTFEHAERATAEPERALRASNDVRDDAHQSSGDD